MGEIGWKVGLVRRGWLLGGGRERKEWGLKCFDYTSYKDYDGFGFLFVVHPKI